MLSATASTPTAIPNSKAFRRDIEGLRAVAVIGVVAYHFGLRGIPGGFVGVDVFFVISGYLITGLLIHELENNGKIDLLRFYGRRARRLLPALLLMTVATLAAVPLIVAPMEQLQFAKSAGATSLYVSNIAYLWQERNYFAPLSVPDPFLHTWSLAVEEQFYLVWPMLVLLACRSRVRSVRLAVTLGSVTLLSFALGLWLTRHNQPWAFYLSPARAWEFGAGGLAALPWVTRWSQRSKWMPAVGWIATAGLLVSYAVISEAGAFPGFLALLPAAATACLLVSGADLRERGPAAILSTAPFQWFGRRSYSIYLWHWPIVVLALSLYPSMHAGGRLLCCALTLVCAAASYTWVEDPIRRNPWLALPAIRSVGLGACLTVSGVVVALGIGVLAKHFAASPGQRAIISVARRAPISTKKGCMVSMTGTKVIPCVFGVASSPLTVVLFGDSHAAEWSTPLVSIAEAEGWRLVTYLKASCAAADIPVYSMLLHRYMNECADWRTRAMDEITRLRPNVVIVSEYSHHYMNVSRQSGRTLSMSDWASGLKKSVTTLRGAGSLVVLLRDSPSPAVDMRNCLENAEWRGVRQNCDIPQAVAIDPVQTATERQLASTIPGVHFIDLTSRFCDGATCPAWRNGVLVYRDDSHITVNFAASLNEPLRGELLAVLKH
jgi:peptidoglycan/LPS O-acetylase OafA/YrhL